MSERTYAQQIATAENAIALEDSVVPKALRNEALQLANTIEDPERRSHARHWIRYNRRQRSQLISFIERMTPAVPEEVAEQ